MAVFWVVAPCGLVEVHRRFRDACCLHRQDDRPEDSHLQISLLFTPIISNVFKSGKCAYNEIQGKM
jgi:hypothetical protein